MATSTGNNEGAPDSGAELKLDDAQGRDAPPYADDEEEVKVCGCIPQHVEGDLCFGLSFYINPTVMGLAILVIWSFVIWCAVWPEEASEDLAKAQAWATSYFGWFYISALIFFGAFAFFLVFSRFGDIKLGHPDKPPKYSILTWFSMLFSAGVGVGLYFYGVAEPVYHFDQMQSGESRWFWGSYNQQAMDALNVSWFHWGLTASAVYCVAALPLAYQHHVKGEPLRESQCFVALIGKKYADGIIGQLIDLTSVIGTMFGVATSLGLGVMQINAGLKFVFDVEENLNTQLVIIWVITAFATCSVLTGLDAGIRRLSELNFGFSFVLLFFMFFAGQPFYLLNLFIQGIGYHVQWFFELTFSTQAFEQEGFYDVDDCIGDRCASNHGSFMAGWTIFYWAWWIAWAPFVGIFIAQISEGRTVREFIVGNMLVPTLFTCIWLTIFGGVGLWNELAAVQLDIECPVGTLFGDCGDANNTLSYTTLAPNATACLSWEPEDVTGMWSVTNDGDPYEKEVIKLSCFGFSHQLFALLYVLPLPTVMSVLALVGILTYFVTSSDSASHVIDVLTANGNDEPPKLQRIFWALSEGAVASVLLSVGDSTGVSALGALQTASLVAALPFTFVLIGEVMATYKTLRIHLGELDPDKLVYWKYDIIESFHVDLTTWVISALCPPYVLMTTRTRIVDINERQRGTTLYSDAYAAGFTQSMFVAAYWTLYVLVIVLCLVDFAEDGFLQLGLTLYLFWIALCVGNRQMIKQFYGIDSSNIVFDILSWTFCWCWAGVQEDLQSRDGEVMLKVKEEIGNSDENAPLTPPQVYGSADPSAPTGDEVEMGVAAAADAEEYVQ